MLQFENVCHLLVVYSVFLIWLLEMTGGRCNTRKDLLTLVCCLQGFVSICRKEELNVILHETLDVVVLC